MTCKKLLCRDVDKTSPYCEHGDRSAEHHPFALISLKIQLNYFAIAARPSSVPASDMHEIRNSRSVTCLPRLLVAYARVLLRRNIPPSERQPPLQIDTGQRLYPNNDVDAVDTSRRMRHCGLRQIAQYGA